jgi:hypothetical protein
LTVGVLVAVAALAIALLTTWRAIAAALLRGAVAAARPARTPLGAPIAAAAVR